MTSAVQNLQFCIKSWVKFVQVNHWPLTSFSTTSSPTSSAHWFLVIASTTVMRSSRIWSNYLNRVYRSKLLFGRRYGVSKAYSNDNGEKIIYLDAKLTWIISIEERLFMVAACSTALQLLPSVDETHAGTTSNYEADLEPSRRLHKKRTREAQKKLGSFRPQRLHRLLPEGDPGGQSLLMLQPWHSCSYTHLWRKSAEIWIMMLHAFAALPLLIFVECVVSACGQNKGQAESTFKEENLIFCVMDLFVAGSETTSTTLRWAFLYMAKYPEIQGGTQQLF